MLINTTKYGQLGNRLQLFAHYIAFSIANDQKIMNLGFAEYAHLFEITSRDIFCRYPGKESILKFYFLRTLLYKLSQLLIKIFEKINIKKIKIINSYPYTNSNTEFRLDDPEFLSSIKKNQAILTHGYYFVDYINFLKYSDKIREYFKPLAVHRSNINTLIDNARESCDVLVGVHIRHGDYKGYLGGKFFYEIDNFITIMKKTEKLFPDKKVGFLICSDESHNSDHFSGFTVTFGTNHIIEDMYSLARCDHIIGTPSTYSRWACFYGNVPTYHITNINKEFTLEDFVLYEEIVRIHMQTAPQFPRYSQDTP